MRQKLFVIDAQWLIYQAFHALPAMTGPTGEPTNAVFGFTRDLLAIRHNRKPDYLLCAFDTPEPTFRHRLYDQYKANRGPMPDDLRPQIPRIQELLEAFPVATVIREGFEADDLIGTVARQAVERGLDVVICTNDKDARQLVGPHVRLYTPRGDKFTGPEQVEKDMGVRPDQIIEYMALTGDSSDNIPGVRGIGPKTASQLIQQYGTLEEVLAHADQQKGKRVREGLTGHVEEARLSRQLVTIDTEVPIEIDWDACRTQPFDVPRLKSQFESLGFHRFAGEIQDGQAADAGQAFTWKLIDTADAYADFLEKLRKQKRFCIDLETTSLSPVRADIVGLAFAWETAGGHYLALRTPDGTPHLEAEQVLADLRPILQDPSVGKVGQNLKYDAVVLRQAGIELAGMTFDTMVADYLLEAGQRNHSLDDLAGRYLNHRMIPIGDLIGKGKDQITIDQVEPKRVAEYAVEDAVVAFRLAEVLEPKLSEAGLWNLFAEVELPLVDVLGELEHNGIRVAPAVLEKMSEDFGKQLAALEKDIYRVAGHEFNIGSPKQLAVVLFEELGLPTVRKTKTGYSTDSEVLEQLAAAHELPALIIRHRQLAKLKGTYLDALPAMINPATGRVHASFNQVVTATGRLSSSDPNLQNIPVRSEEGKLIRQAFVAADEKHVLLTADYSQIELRVLAHFSGDPAMVEAFQQNQDIHTAVAARIYGVQPDEVTSEMRRGAKTVNFGIIYGLSPFGLSHRLGISQAEATDFIDAYFFQYEGVTRFIESVLEGAQAKGFVKTILGRRRAITGIKNTAGRQRNLAERTAVNTVIQGSAADLIKVAMNNIHRRLTDEPRGVRMVLQIHDELVFDVPESELDGTLAMVREEMTGAIPLKVPVQVDVACGKNWMEVA